MNINENNIFDLDGFLNISGRCAPGYTGKRCEMLTTVSFGDTNSFVELDMLKAKPDANVTLSFATTQQNGVIIYNGQKHHIAVELFRGRIRVSYDVGNYPVSTMFSYEQVADGDYHKVELLVAKQNFTMRIDGGRSRTIINNGENEYIELDTSLYLGGLPKYAGEVASKQWHLRNISSINGLLTIFLIFTVHLFVAIHNLEHVFHCVCLYF